MLALDKVASEKEYLPWGGHPCAVFLILYITIVVFGTSTVVQVCWWKIYFCPFVSCCVTCLTSHAPSGHLSVYNITEHQCSPSGLCYFTLLCTLESWKTLREVRQLTRRQLSNFRWPHTLHYQAEEWDNIKPYKGANEYIPYVRLHIYNS